ncbi:DUF4255 domain-containing protein [Streptomyces olivoreticuli]
MINEVDEALREIVDALPTGCAVEFQAPTREWSAGLLRTVVNLFLYDIREDVGRSETGEIYLSSLPYHTPPADLASESQHHHESHAPPKYVALSYMATVWANRDVPEDVHRVLSLLLTGFARHRVLNIPEFKWPEHLARMRPQATLELTQPMNDSRALTELWSAIDNTLMPFINLKVTLPMETFSVKEPAEPPREVDVEVKAQQPGPRP